MNSWKKIKQNLVSLPAVWRDLRCINWYAIRTYENGSITRAFATHVKIIDFFRTFKSGNIDSRLSRFATIPRATVATFSKECVQCAAVARGRSVAAVARRALTLTSQRWRHAGVKSECACAFSMTSLPLPSNCLLIHLIREVYMRDSGVEFFTLFFGNDDVITRQRFI